MTDFETKHAGLPVVVGGWRARPSLLRIGTPAPFVSQLIAERDHLPPQRAHRRASAQGAVGAYAEGARVAVKRMPLGYRTTIVA